MVKTARKFLQRPPLVVAMDEWLASEEGRSCTSARTLKAPFSQRKYLENRLRYAFEAGFKAGYNPSRRCR